MLLDVWREVCRHILIDESVARVIPFLVREIPLQELLIRSIDVARSCLDTVALGMYRPRRCRRLQRRSAAARIWIRILGWCREGRVECASEETLRQRLPGLLASRPYRAVSGGAAGGLGGGAGGVDPGRSAIGLVWQGA